MRQLFPPEIINYSAESYYFSLSKKSSIIYRAVLLFLFLIIVLLPLIKIDISSQSRGIIRTPGENVIIQSAIYAEVISFNMSENKSIRKGDTLLTLNTERLDEQIFLKKQNFEQNLEFIHDISELLKENTSPQNLLTSKYKGEYNQCLSKIKEQTIQIDYLKKEYEVNKGLFDKKVISEFDFLQQKNNWEKALGLLAYIKEEYRTNWQNEQTRIELENQTHTSAVKQLEKEKRQHIIVAPVGGTLTQVSGFQTGNFIAPGHTLAYISPLDSLLIECYVSPADIGYFKKDQDASFQVDAFDYREWGLLHGNVVEILDDVITVENKPMFRVRCKVNNPCLELKNGYKGCIKKGLTLTGRFHLTRRSLWQLLFDKVDNWMNPKIIADK